MYSGPDNVPTCQSVCGNLPASGSYLFLLLQSIPVIHCWVHKVEPPNISGDTAVFISDLVFIN